MNTGYDVPTYGENIRGYQTVETLLDDVMKQMASSNIARYTRGSIGQRIGGGSMRIVKPNSTSNSPRGPTGLGRRRTVMTDRRRIAMAEPNLPSSEGFLPHDGLQVPKRTNRPSSWHPSSQMAPQSRYLPTYELLTSSTQPDIHDFDLPPTLAMYSGYGSPDSNFSPMSMPCNAYEQQYTGQNAASTYQFSNPYSSHQNHAFTPFISSRSDETDSRTYSHPDWSNLATHGFQSSTSPPTPENFLPIQHSDADFSTEDSIPYHSLSDSEPEGEVLQGLGLYDTPAMSKTPPSISQLGMYHSLDMSQLLGAPQRKTELESTGTGLKLEETWTPPSDDDDDGEDEDVDEDGEGEDEDDLLTADSTRRSNGTMDGMYHVTNAVRMNQGLDFNGGSWL